MFGAPDATPRIIRDDAAPPVWRVSTPAGPLGLIASTWEIAGSVGYSGLPIDILVALTPEGRIAGAELIRHNEPILTLGLSSEDIAAYVSAFRGVDLTKPRVDAFAAREDLPPIIARATVTTGVIRDAILRTARVVALGRGLIGGGASGLDRLRFSEKTWTALAADGSLSRATLSLSAARAAFGAVTNPPPEGAQPFLDIWIGLLDPPSIGRNLLGRQGFTEAMAALGAGDAALFVASRGLQSHRGTAWRRDGLFDRLELIQGPRATRFHAQDYRRIDRLALTDAPSFKEISVFRVPADSGFDPTQPFTLEVSAERTSGGGDIASIRVPVDYRLPAEYLTAATAAAEFEPLWRSAWKSRRLAVGGVALMLATLGGGLFFQEPLVRRPRLWRRARTGFLLVTLIWLGWIAGGQLSVVQAAAFIHALLSGFRWETFLIEPVIFLLWGFVAVGLLFWGRGVYCGWLCPFGALQELLNQLAKRLGAPRIEIPFVIHERLWAIKYVLFLGILALSFYSMEQALILAEVEPFKTAMSLRFMRAWPFVLFAVGLLIAGLFIERFYCRYLCPLGAALAIPAKIKLFDWMNRRPQCGRECRLCEQKCMVQAIDPLGRINPNECVLCLRCQVIFHDAAQCTVLKQRAARQARPMRGGGA